MSSNENNNNFAIPTVGGGFVGVATNGSIIQQVAMQAMQQSGAAGVVVQLSAQGPGQNDPTVVTGVLDRDGNFRVLHRTNDPPANN